MRKLAMLNRIVRTGELQCLPGNRLGRSRGDRKGQRSIRIDDPWRICLRCVDGRALGVEIVDDH